MVVEDKAISPRVLAEMRGKGSGSMTAEDLGVGYCLVALCLI